MTKDGLMLGVIGLLAGVIITGFVAGQAVNNHNTGMMRLMGIEENKPGQTGAGHGAMSMSDMTEQLKGKSGDDFDKAFIEMMIIHHQGAIDMARLIDANAKHDELKQLGKDIISAQSKEIDMMQTWQSNWGYKATPQSHNLHDN